MHFYKSLVYCQNINMDTDTGLLLLMQFKLFIPSFQTIVIMVFILVQYSSTYQRCFIQLPSKFYFKKLYFNFGIRGILLQL